MDKEENELILRVEEISKSSAGRSICRIDPESMKQLGLSAGDIVEIIGKKSSPAIVFPSSRDKNQNIIRIDGLMRLNTGSTVGEYVKIRPTKPLAARYIKLSYTQKNIQITSNVRNLAGAMQGKPMKSGDIVAVVKQNVARKKESLNPPLEEFQKIMGGMFQAPSVSLGEVRFLVKKTIPDGIVQVTKNTEIEISKEVSTSPSGTIITYDDIGGLSDALQKVREMIELPLKHPELFQRVNIDPPKGVLLYGPPGTGKTLMARAVSQEANAYFITLNGPEVMSKFYGESEQNLRKLFDEAEKNAPSIIFIDEIDSIAPKRENVTGEVERRVVAQLLSLLDGLRGRGKVIVIGATNRVNSIDPALRRPGRFDREIELGVPDKEGRKEIFQIHTRGMPLSADVNLEEYANITHGFVGADIMAVCREAAMASLRTILPEIDLDKPIPLEILDKLIVTDEHFAKAIRMVEPSAMREVMIEIPDIKWEDIGGLESIREELQETVEWPVKYPHIYKNAGIRQVNGVLLFGPPGCGKTLLAKAVANESELNFLSVKGPEIFSKWVGESEKAVRELFRKARLASPSIVYFDEMDSIASSRASFNGGSHVSSQVVNQILVEMDGLEDRKGIVVIASTNRLDLLDKALLRPGRFDRIIYTPAPDEDARFKILKVHTKDMNLTDEAIKFLPKLALITEHYSGADLDNLCRESGMQAIRDFFRSNPEDAQNPDRKILVEQHHFETSLKKIQPSLTEDVIKEYDKMADEVSKRRTKIETRSYSAYT
ncbi:MAG: CDC48 family AAA ATPase [Candidatus Lokiarchaeota archaeon]|nr:CDC48 family AAA ATPase [Candidatus Lokiarchaeota archaeon]